MHWSTGRRVRFDIRRLFLQFLARTCQTTMNHWSKITWPRFTQKVLRPPVLVLEAVLLLSAIQTTTAQTLTSLPSSNAAAAFHPEKLAEIDAAVNQAIAEGNCPGAVVWLERNGVNYRR